MSPRHFEDLLSHLRLCKPNPPAIRDRFWEVREMIKAWRDNMAAVFIPSWISVGDSAAVDGSLNDTHYNVWCMREPDYTMKIMGTASGLFPVDDRVHSRTWKEAGETKTASFNYTDPFYLHFKYLHA
eukprot:CCRYP_008606-RA/>CCRYP_008606-RA protein AED:0.36 eAED:0.36 QI:0/0/0/1/0/0/2/0/126